MIVTILKNKKQSDFNNLTSDLLLVNERMRLYSLLIAILRLFFDGEAECDDDDALIGNDDFDFDFPSTSLESHLTTLGEILR